MTRRGEFGVIDELFAPLARGNPAGLALTDDAALLDVIPGHEIVATTDALVEGVHFHADDAPDLIGRKLLRVNLSDLAAMGAEPYVYLLTLAVPSGCGDTWLERFTGGLARDQQEFDIHLAGGDTVSTEGTLVLSLTAFGIVPSGQALRRSAATEGEDLWTSGTIGDSALALEAKHAGLEAAEVAFLKDRYLLPRPRIALGIALRGVASACIDVSDGLVADLGHVCRSSGIGGEVWTTSIPLSRPARAVLGADTELIRTVLGGGDDYELLFCAPPERREDIETLAQGCGVAVTRIGRMHDGDGVVVLDAKGAEISLTFHGYTHF